MKRDSQFVLESSIIGSLLIFTVLGGSFATLSVPREWSILVNPSSAPTAQEPNALSLYYNQTLSSLGTGLYSNVSLLLSTFRFVNIAAALNQTAQTGNSQIASMNVSVPEAASDFQVAARLSSQSQFLNATAFAANGCQLAGQANMTLSDFKTSTVPELVSLGVPSQPYAIGLALTSDVVSSLLATCAAFQSPFPIATLSIGSLQKSVETGGNVELFGNLTLNGEAIASQTVFFYLNGTLIGSGSTNSSGGVGGTFTIPFVYEPVGVVQAFVATNQTAGFRGTSSNELNLLILFNGTQIVIGDPPAYLPTFSFSVHGNLTSAGGIPLPSAPVRVTFINETRDTTTDSFGGFGAQFTVPADARDGAYDVYAAFAPRGVYGPSFNFTSVQVTREPLEMIVKVSSLTLTGFSASVQGRLIANGTGVAGARVTVSSPWGSYQATSDSTGQYTLSVPTSLLDFAFSGSLKVSANPAQPYIASDQVLSNLSLFNFLIVVIPAIVVAALGYGAVSLGLLRGKEKFKQYATLPALKEATTDIEPLNLGVDTPKIVLLYLQTLRLAAEKFQLRFGRNQTLREIAAKISTVADQHGSAVCSQVLGTMEDFLYAETFDGARVKEAEAHVAELQEMWKK